MSKTECENVSSFSSGDARHFCGHCESDQSCKVLEGISSQIECDNASDVCVFVDGTMEPMTIVECNSTYRCTHLCQDGRPCLDEQACNEAGQCIGSENIYNAM